MGLITSWVATANLVGCQFPANNLPYGVFLPADGGPRCGVAIGDLVLDVGAVGHGLDPLLFEKPSWNRIMAAGRSTWDQLRKRLIDLLTDEANRIAVSPHLYALSDVQLLMPFEVSGYTDFYASRHHAFNVGSM